MLAATAGKRLRIIEPALLKSSSSSTELPQTALDVELTSLAWTSDASSLMVSTHRTIRRYDANGRLKKVLYSLEEEGQISALAVQDESTVIFSNGPATHIYDCSSSSIVKTFPEHASSVACLSLSNDATLLAVASSTACTVENLVDGTHTSLSGLPCISISACTFHLHSSRLLLGLGNQVLVYDITKPSSPTKAISLASKAMGDIVAFSCSPFSKSLTAVACSGGVVGLVDLEKEKALFKTIDFKTTLTSLSFTADGASLLVGTASGELLIQDLRSLDKPPRKLVVGLSDERILGLAVQHKSKSGNSSKGTVKATTTMKVTSLNDTTNVESPASRRVSKANNSPSKPGVLGRSPAATTRGTLRSTPRGTRKSAVAAVAASTPADSNRKGSVGISPLNVSDNFENTSLQLETLPPMPSLPLAWKTAQKKLGTGVSSPSPPKPRTSTAVVGNGKFATNRPSAMDSISAVVSKAVASPAGASSTRVRALTATASNKTLSAGTISGRTTGAGTARGTLKLAPATTSSVLVSASQSPSSSSVSASGTRSGTTRSAALKSRASAKEVEAEKENATSAIESRRGTVRDKKQDNKAAMRALGVGSGRMPSSRPVSVATTRTDSSGRTRVTTTGTATTTSTAVSASSRGFSGTSISTKTRASSGKENNADVFENERTPSPELPSMNEVMSPVRPLRKVSSMRSTSATGAKEAMLSEMEGDDQDDEPKEWVPGEVLQGGSISEEEDEAHDDNDRDENLNEGEQLPPTTCGALQLSPLRNASISQARPRAIPTTSAAYASLPTPSKLPLSQATGLLRALLAESLVEFREETRDQMRGLHLDLLRVGRGMRKEVREAVGETFGDMQVECKCKGELEALREENERLKEELRRMRMGLGV